MNNVVLIGRITKDPEIKIGGNGNAISSMNLAVDRFFNGTKEADFIPLVAFGKTAELTEKLKKGSRIGIAGNIKTGSYKQGEQTIYTWKVQVDRFEFLDSKANQDAPNKDKFFNDLEEKAMDGDMPW